MIFDSKEQKEMLIRMLKEVSVAFKLPDLGGRDAQNAINMYSAVKDGIVVEEAKAKLEVN